MSPSCDVLLDAIPEAIGARRIGLAIERAAIASQRLEPIVLPQGFLNLEKLMRKCDGAIASFESVSFALLVRSDASLGACTLNSGAQDLSWEAGSKWLQFINRASHLLGIKRFYTSEIRLISHICLNK